MDNQIEVLVEIEEKEIILSGKTYLLYNNEDQGNLLAAAYSEQQIHEESKFYSGGQWFEYDNVLNTKSLVNERIYKKKIKFPEQPLIRPKIETDKKFGDWSK